MPDALAAIADTQQETTSEAQALADILVWSEECPQWQRDALRRLCTKDELDENDVDELTALCKSQGKQAVPLTAEHIPDPKAVTSAVGLRAIHDAEHVNALKANQRLTFDKAG